MRTRIKKLAMIGATVLSLLALVEVLSDVNVKEILGYAKATADTTVRQIEDNVPTVIQDQKLKNDIDEARGEIIDRRVKLNLAASEIRRMEDENQQLELAIKRRETILADAYPALKAAAKDRINEVVFAGTKWLPSELGAEIDKLLMEQDRDERQLTIRRDALQRLIQSVEQGSAAIAQMESKLLEAENEFQALVLRRGQAENENELLDLVAAAGIRGNSAAAQLGRNLEGLRGDVESLEARNEARREAVPVGDRVESRLPQAYNRLERLKALHEEHSANTTGPEIDEVQNLPSHGFQSNSSDTTISGGNGRDGLLIIIKDAQLEATLGRSTDENE
ncbi:MAG: hypothetical protein KDA88_23865 [Planctomycetaceae bacterium]|nr:hypothetical protein [Planctomycetaceae bacterium]MCB9952152.1 hypothetical protein [Planctomycetaceae bacterium]